MIADLQKEPLLEHNVLIRCVIILLRATGWKSDSKFLYEYFENNEDMSSALNGLSNMNYTSQLLRVRLDKIDKRLLPCIFAPDDNDPFVILEKDKKKSFKIYVGKLDSFMTISTYPTWGTALCIKEPRTADTTLHDPQPFWFNNILGRFKKHIIYALFISFILTLLSLSMPFFINLIFSKITTEQIFTDFKILLYGLSLYLGASFILTLIRSRVQTVMSVRLGFLVINEVIRRILFLPTTYTETAPIHSQLARVKDFDSVKEFFSGPAMTAVLDMPFVVILILGLAWIDPVLAVIPLASIVVFAIMALSIKRLVRSTNMNAAQTSKELQEFLLDTLGNLKAVRNLGYTEKWISRFRDLSSRAILSTRQSADVTGLIINLAQGITSFAGLMTMVVGVVRIFSGNLQPTSLVAAMLLTWRILAPLKTGFSVFTQLDRLRRSIEQIDRLMALEIEKHNFSIRKTSEQLEGRLIVSQVSLRYGHDTNPVLLGVSFDAKPGETVVILGHGGSGKSTLLKLVMAMYTPQTGHILIDGKNTKQLDPIALRRSIAYMPSSSNFLSVSLREHIRMVNPHADSNTIEEALAAMGLEEELKQLPRGLNTRLTRENQHIFTPSFLRRFSMSLTMMKKSGLWVLDAPSLNLESSHEHQLKSTLMNAKGKATIIIATQNPEYGSLADRVLILNNGRSVAFAAPEALDAAKPPI